MSATDRMRDASTTTRAKIKELAGLLERSGINIDEIRRVRGVKLYQGFYKDADGNAHTVDMHGLDLVPTWADGPEWPVVQPAAPTVIKPPAKRPKPTGLPVAVVLPDPQIGYRRDVETGELDPFHDEAALTVALQITADAQPAQVVNLGDLLDLPEWGPYEQEPAFQQTTQPTIDRAHRFLAEQRAAAPDAKIVLLEGNHDRRLEKAIRRNAMSAFGLRRANEPESWPVLSVPNLLRLDDLDVTYVGGYPAGIHWVNDNLACIHGHKVRSSGSTAAAVIDDERVSMIFGHVHRIELQHRTRRTRYGAKQSFAASPGCLSRIDGAVPSVKSSTDPMGRPVLSWQNWQQGIAVVEYEPGDGRFWLELVPIIDGTARWRGKTYG